MAVLAFMFGVYTLFTVTVAAAYFSGGWVIVMVDKYREGLAELVLLILLFPAVAYVTVREIASVRRLKKTIINPAVLAGAGATKCRWCRKEIPNGKYLRHLLFECGKFRAWMGKAFTEGKKIK